MPVRAGISNHAEGAKLLAGQIVEGFTALSFRAGAAAAQAKDAGRAVPLYPAPSCANAAQLALTLADVENGVSRIHSSKFP